MSDGRRTPVGKFLRRNPAVMGEMLEQTLRRALSMPGGEAALLWESPILLGLWVSACAIVVGPMLYRRMKGCLVAAAAAV